MGIPHSGPGFALSIVSAIMLCIICTFVFLRCYVHIKVRNGLTPDDYVLFLGLGLYTAYLVAVYHGVHAGIGSHLLIANDLPGALKVCMLALLIIVKC